MRNGFRWTRLAVATMVPLAVATACGTSGSGSASAPPPSSAASGTAVVNPTPAAAANTRSDQTWAGIDPCALLGAAQLKPFLANTPANPSRADAEGKHVCAWGDGEFRSVRLSVWQPASVDELTKDAVRQVPVGGKNAQVVRDAEYSCAMQVGDARMAVNLETVSMDKIKLCADTTTALTAVVAKLPE